MFFHILAKRFFPLWFLVVRNSRLSSPFSQQKRKNSYCLSREPHTTISLIWFFDVRTGMTDVFVSDSTHVFCLMVFPTEKVCPTHFVNFFQQTWKIDVIGCLLSLMVFLNRSVKMSTYFVIIFSSQQESEKVHWFFLGTWFLNFYFFNPPVPPFLW